MIILLLEKLTVAHRVKICPTIHGTRRFTTVLTKACHWSTSTRLNCLRSIIFPFTHGASNCSLPSRFHKYPTCISHLFDACDMPLEIQCRRKYATISVFYVDILTFPLWKLRWEQNTFILKIEIARSSETQVMIYHTTEREHVSGNSNLCSRRGERLKSLNPEQPIKSLIVTNAVATLQLKPFDRISTALWRQPKNTRSRWRMFPLWLSSRII
jgi:hypothetical protein